MFLRLHTTRVCHELKPKYVFICTFYVCVHTAYMYTVPCTMYIRTLYERMYVLQKYVGYMSSALKVLVLCEYTTDAGQD